MDFSGGWRLFAFYFVAYVILALCVGYFGRNRSIGFWGWAICSIIFTPLPCLIILLISKPRKLQAA
jgi:hypothetical protein